MVLEALDINSSVEVAKDVVTGSVKDFYFTAWEKVGTFLVFLGVVSYHYHCPRMVCNIQELKMMFCLTQSPQLPFF